MILLMIGFITLIIGVGLIIGALGLYLVIVGGIGESIQYNNAMNEVKEFLDQQNVDLEPDGMHFEVQFDDPEKTKPYLEITTEQSSDIQITISESAHEHDETESENDQDNSIHGSHDERFL
jgi:hypothetical protein